MALANRTSNTFKKPPAQIHASPAYEVHDFYLVPVRQRCRCPVSSADYSLVYFNCEAFRLQPQFIEEVHNVDSLR